MAEWWWSIVVLALLVAAIVVVLRARTRGDDLGDGPGAMSSTRDFTQERETHRTGQMSDEDRAWEAASLQTNRDSEARNQESPPRS